MIHYDLVCPSGHGFDGWFASSSAFDRQRDAGLVTCPSCHSAAVDRALMAPAVARRDRGDTPAAAAPAAEPEILPPPPNVALSDGPSAKMRAAVKAFRQAVIDNGVDVGREFPDEARKIHNGEAEPRGIYGQADLEEARALLEEGIAIMPLPILPDERN